MNDKLERQLTAMIDDDGRLENEMEAGSSPELGPMAAAVRRVKEARAFKPASPGFADRGWEFVRQQTQTGMARTRRKPAMRTRRGWLTAAASILLAVTAVFAGQWWTSPSVSAAEIHVTGTGVVADLGVHIALYPRYAGSLDTVSYSTQDQIKLWHRSAGQASDFPLAFAYIREAAWSPDGTQLAFSGYPSARPGPGIPGIWVADRSGANPREIAKPGDADTYYESPVWSPDGKRIAFTATKAVLSDQTGVVYERNVVVVNADGSNMKAAARGMQPAWSPDGKQLAYTAEARDGPPEIWISDADGKQARRLTVGKMPAWSPSSPFLVFTKIRTEHRVLETDASGKETFAADVTYEDLWAVNAESGSESRLTESAYPQALTDRMLSESKHRGETSAVYAVSGVTADGQAAWSPDGKRVLFTRDVNEEQGRHFTLQELYIEYR